MPLENIKKNKDSPINTAIVAGSLCLVCALVVSTAASVLKDIQDKNIALDRKKNLLLVTKFPEDAIASPDSIESTFTDNFDQWIIDMDTGERAEADCLKAMSEIGKKGWTDKNLTEKYDQYLASKTKKKEVCTKIEKGADPANVKYREKYSYVYRLKNEDGTTKTWVLPIRGYGLWSMMHGYLAIKPDFQTVEGIVFYDQAETPGLGGEVKSERFMNWWPGKQLFGEDGEVRIQVVKGAEKSSKHDIDAISGATITSNGVTKAMKYWLGPEGFKPFIDRMKDSTETSAAEKAEADDRQVGSDLETTGVRNG